MRQTAPRLASLLAVLFAASLGARGQALPVADKTQDISVFLATGHINPDYGKTSNSALTGGLNFTRYFRRLPVDPSLELRGNYADTSQVTEKSVLVGLRLTRDLKRLHPYGFFLVGGAEITFQPNPYPGYTGDRGRIYDFGGGVTIDLLRHFALVGDYQYQQWNLGKNQSVTATGDFTLTPVIFTGGLQYTIPFRVRNRQSDVR